MGEKLPYNEVKFNYEIVHRKDICTTRISPHIHDTVEIYLNLSYLPNVLLENQVVSAEPGTLILIPPFTLHQLFDKTDELYDRYILSVDTVWLDNVFLKNSEGFPYLKESRHPLLLHLLPAALGALQQSLDQLLSVSGPSSFNTMAYFFRCMSLVDEIVHINISQKNQKGMGISTTQQTVNDIIRYLNEHSEEAITLQDLSGHFYMNPDYISRIFKKHIHTTVGSYITLQKIARAQQLLQEGYTVTQAQLMTGYSSYAHFSRTFKRQTGMPPGAYRSRMSCQAPSPRALCDFSV